MRLLPPRIPGAGAAQRLAGLARRSSRLTGRVALDLLERAADLADRWRDAGPDSPTPSAAAFVQSPPSAQPGVIREVTEYVRRTIVSEPSEPGPARPVPAPESAPQPPAAPVPVGPSPHLRHLSLLVERWLMQLRRYKNFEQAPDPVEAVHDLRVASRRLRALLDTFEPFLEPKLVKRTRRPLREITRAVGVLREWDVNAQQLSKRLRHSESDAERAALEYLLDRIDARRARERKRALARLKKIDFDAVPTLVRRSLDQLAERAGSPSSSFETLASVALEEAIDRVCSQRLPDLGHEDTAQMHRLRIATKRLRYAIELVKPALGDSYPALHQRAKGLQDLLGKHHDRVVLEELVGVRRRKLELRGREVLVRGLEPVLEHLAADRLSLYERFAALPIDLEPGALQSEARAALEAAARA